MMVHPGAVRRSQRVLRELAQQLGQSAVDHPQQCQEGEQAAGPHRQQGMDRARATQPDEVEGQHQQRGTEQGGRAEGGKAEQAGGSQPRRPTWPGQQQPAGEEEQRVADQLRPHALVDAGRPGDEWRHPAQRRGRGGPMQNEKQQPVAGQPRQHGEDGE